ncbi:hypothetical protein Z043_107976 [Scleropages formosus]|uniref:Cadherin N-terminal domain-containing protein n=1 Tax=Scleropages formosus TaxID=113540 RepID=A0A0P7YXP8_SCLFO|nr:hypothetical protein Z043_107976 [Scleropages formosus]
MATCYSIPHEMEEGSVVTNLASDLGFDVNSLAQCDIKLDIIYSNKYLDINRNTGELYIIERIDGEYLCLVQT